MLIQAQCNDLGLPEKIVADAMEQSLTNMTLLHNSAAAEPRTGIHPHKDTKVLTLIACDAVSGLEAMDRTVEWLQVRCPSDGFIVNIGDML